LNFKALIRASQLRDAVATDLAMATLSSDAHWLLEKYVSQVESFYAAFPHESTFAGNLELSSYPDASGSWYHDRNIGFLIWNGDLVVHGDLVDDHFHVSPILIVRGNLYVDNWLRGGMPSLVAGRVHAKGFVIGHYNDSALFISGDLQAEGYLPRAVPYPDFPNIVPHQIGGRIDARSFDIVNCSDEALRQTFVDDVLIEDDDSEDDKRVAFDERLAMDRWRAGLSVWR
jgi:hypothetical protein